MLAEDGREQVSGYHMLGDIIGLDGIGTDHHGCQAVALEDTEVCVLPFERLEDLARKLPALQHNLHQFLSREIARDHNIMLLLGSMRAEERLAVFLLNLSERYRRRGYSSTEFVLRMTREEIGSYLGLKLETVSRLFSRFQEEGLIQVQGRAVKIARPAALKQLVGQRLAESPAGRPLNCAAASPRRRSRLRASGSPRDAPAGRRAAVHLPGERSRNTVSADDAMPSAQKPKKPIV